MGGVVKQMGKGVSSALEELNSQKSTAAYYSRLAAEKDYQAAYAAAAAQQQNGYLLQSAHEQAQQVYQNYRQQTASQRVQLAASGLRSDSATVQYLLQNSRFQALLEEDKIKQNLQADVAENNRSGAEQVRALKQTADDYRRLARTRSSGWKFGTSWLGLFEMN